MLSGPPPAAERAAGVETIAAERAVGVETIAR